LALVEGKRVRKVRYYYEEEGVAYEIDVFQDALAGLVLIDVEFASLDEKARFVPPAWLGADVTQEEFVAGGMLCGKGYEDVAGELARFGYVPIGVSLSE
jgi:CYTH domain-containing protein